MLFRSPNCRPVTFDTNFTRMAAYLNARGTICGTDAQCTDGLEVNSSLACWTDNYATDETGTVLNPVSFSSPLVDLAPWYDPAFPESAGFFGFYLQDVTGFDSVLGRDVKPRTVGQGGGSFGPLRPKARSMNFRLLAFGCDDTSLDYAMRWLIDVLAAQCDPCGGCRAWVRFSCPDSTTKTPLGVTETLLSRWKQNRWQMKQVALTDGPRWGAAPVQDNTCRVRSVEFTLTAADPYLYKDESGSTIPQTWAVAGGSCVPLCDWVDNIYGRSYQVCQAVDSTANLGETVANVTIFTGSSGLAQLDITGRTPNLNGTCPAPTASNPTIFTLKLAGLPANSTVVVNTADRKITVRGLDGIVRDAFYLINLNAEQTFGFPVVSRGRICFCAIVSACSVSSNATVAITTQYRLL